MGGNRYISKCVVPNNVFQMVLYWRNYGFFNYLVFKQFFFYNLSTNIKKDIVAKTYNLFANVGCGACEAHFISQKKHRPNCCGETKHNSMFILLWPMYSLIINSAAIFSHVSYILSNKYEIIIN